jgi:hypothetical protein
MNNDEHNLTEFDKTAEVEVSYFKKWIYGLVDAAIVIGFFLLISRYLPYGPLYKLISSVNPSIFALILLIIYRLITILPLGATPGMLLFKIKFLTGEEKPPTIGEKILAVFFILTNGIKYYDKR